MVKPEILSLILLRGVDMLSDILTTVYQELIENNLHTTQRILVSSGYDAITRKLPIPCVYIARLFSKECFSMTLRKLCR